MEVNGRAIVFWDCDGEAEELHHKSQAAAIEAKLDDRKAVGEIAHEGSVLVFGYARMVVSPSLVHEDWMIDTVLEAWSEYCSEDGPDVTDGMRAAAKAFVAAMAKEFVPWACEVVHSEEVDVAAWLEQREREIANAEEATG